MAKTVAVPVTLVRKMARAAQAFGEMEDALEDYLLSQDPEFVGRMREARTAHLGQQVRPLGELKKELCIE